MGLLLRASRWPSAGSGRDTSYRRPATASRACFGNRSREVPLGRKACRSVAGGRARRPLMPRRLTVVSSSNDDGESKEPEQVFDDFMSEFTVYLEKVMPYIQANGEDLNNMRNVLELTAQMQKKLENIRGQNIKFDWLSRLMLTMISKSTELIRRTAEERLDFLLAERKSNDVSIVHSDDRSYLEVKDTESTEEPSSSIQMNEIGSGTFNLQDDTLYEKGNAIFSISLILGASVLCTSLAQTAGLDVESRLGMPDHPLQVAAQCLAWTAPAALVSFTFWRWILGSDTDAGRVYRAEALTNPEVLTKLSLAEVAIFTSLIEVGAGLVSRGVGLSVSSLFFLGIPRLTETNPLFTDPEAVLQPHFPETWLWPCVALGCGTLEAVLFQVAKGGFREDTRDWLEEECTAALFSSLAVNEFFKMDVSGWMDLSTGGVNLPEELEDAIRPRDGTESPEQNKRDETYDFPLLDAGRAQDFALDLQGYMMMASDDPALKKFVKGVPLGAIQDFTEQFSKNIKLRGPGMFYNPLQYLVKGTFLAAETILTGSLWASIFTGSVMLFSEEMASRAYLKDHPEVLESN